MAKSYYLLIATCDLCT